MTRPCGAHRPRRRHVEVRRQTAVGIRLRGRERAAPAARPEPRPPAFERAKEEGRVGERGLDSGGRQATTTIAGALRAAAAMASARADGVRPVMTDVPGIEPGPFDYAEEQRAKRERGTCGNSDGAPQPRGEPSIVAADGPDVSGRRVRDRQTPHFLDNGRRRVAGCTSRRARRGRLGPRPCRVRRWRRPPSRRPRQHVRAHGANDPAGVSASKMTVASTTRSPAISSTRSRSGRMGRTGPCRRGPSGRNSSPQSGRRPGLWLLRDTRRARGA